MGVEWHEYHYAPLIEALCKADRLKEAFGTLDIMRSNSIIPTTETAQPITDFLKQDIDRVDRVWRILDELQKESKAVDTTAINAVIQACVALDDLQRAIGAYKAFADYGCKPNVDTFNSLLSGCVGAKHRDFGNKILLDLKQASVKPDARTYEHIIQLCLTEPTYEDAFFYLEEMKTQKFMPSAKAYEAIIRTCISARDSRYSLALSEMGHCGYTPSPSLQRFMAKSNSTDLPQTHNTL